MSGATLIHCGMGNAGGPRCLHRTVTCPQNLGPAKAGNSRLGSDVLPEKTGHEATLFKLTRYRSLGTVVALAAALPWPVPAQAPRLTVVGAGAGVVLCRVERRGPLRPGA
jgi:hypothetical protein